jgi:GDSL-like Lipase/Acylhydrolase family
MNRQPAEAGHVALLGDSVLDNGAYTSGGPDVVTQLRTRLPDGWRASLLAVDGSMIADLPSQISKLPPDASHLVISIGGNDVLANMDALGLKVRSAAEALLRIGDRVDRFERSYRHAVDRACALHRDTTICTIYNGNLPCGEAEVARIGLRTFNDVILRVAFENKLAVIDLRLVCSEPADYANPIEPSSRGGEKIAQAILRSVGLGKDRPEPSRVFI